MSLFSLNNLLLLKRCIYIWKAEWNTDRGRWRQENSSNCLFLPQMPPGVDKQRPGARSSIQLSHAGGGVHASGPSSSAFQGTLVRDWIKTRVEEIQGSLMWEVGFTNRGLTWCDFSFVTFSLSPWHFFLETYLDMFLLFYAIFVPLIPKFSVFEYMLFFKHFLILVFVALNNMKHHN